MNTLRYVSFLISAFGIFANAQFAPFAIWKGRSSQYATASLGGTKLMVFLLAPSGTALLSDANYKAFCESKGFAQNQNGASGFSSDSSGFYNGTNYYSNSYCSFLGSGNSKATTMTSFQNYGLPLSTGLKVIDRGCGNWGGAATSNASQSWDTSDTLTLSSNTTYTYSPGGGNYNTYKGTITSTGTSVVVCQMP